MKKTTKSKAHYSKIAVLTFLIASIALILGTLNQHKSNSYRVQEVFSSTTPIKINDNLATIVEDQINNIESQNTADTPVANVGTSTKTPIPVAAPVDNSNNTELSMNNVGAPGSTTIGASITTSQVNPFYQQKIFAEKGYNVQNQLSTWQRERPADAEKLKIVADNAGSKWVVGGTANDAFNQVNDYVSRAATQGAIPVLIAYNIPIRDCNSYSSGGAHSAADYLSWIDAFVRGIGSRKAAVVLEPDSLSSIDCLSSDKQQERMSLLSSAVSKLKQNSNTFVYIDAGHSKWISVTEMVIRLNKSNVSKADGFALNVSNFQPTNDSIKYGEQISVLIGGKHFIIDTSRNGLGPTIDNQWCNPSGRALGHLPSASTGHPLVDALLWLKVPGESDGNCNGGPNAGQWWADYALELINNYLNYVAKTLPAVSTSQVVEEPKVPTPSNTNVAQPTTKTPTSNNSVMGEQTQQNTTSADWEVKSDTNENVLKLGNKVLISSAIKTNLKDKVVDAIVDVEIYNKDHKKIDQKFFEAQTFEPGIVKQYTLLWQPKEAGEFTVKVGVFSKNWQKSLVWESDALNINIASQNSQNLSTNVNSSQKIEIWWPTDQSRVSGIQPFKAVVTGLDLKQYNLYWQVDGDRLNIMENNYSEHPHKEIMVNLSSWTWKSDKSYKVKFIAKDLAGNIFAQKEIQLIAN